MSIRRLVQLLLGTLFVLAATVAVLVVVGRIQRSHLLDLERRRLRSYELADELRHTSDDLTRFARSYVATDNPRYEAFYRDVLAMRAGRMPLPEHYERIYWDLYLDSGRPPRPSGSAVSLLDRMRAAGFTAAELEKLGEAEATSDALTAIEQNAFHAVKGEYRDAAGRFTRRGRPDRASALRMLFDSSYVHQKALIMRPIDDFLGMVETRTAAELGGFDRETRLLVAFGEAALVAFLLLVALSYRVLRRRVLEPVDELQRQTRGVAGDLERLAGVAKGIAGGDLSRSFSTSAPRIGSQRPDEIGELSRLHDTMLGELQGTGAAIASITAELSVARRSAEEARGLSERRFTSIFRESPVGLTVTDRETGKITAANAAFVRVVGAASVDAVLGKRTMELGIWDGDDAARLRAIAKVVEHNRPEGTIVPVRLPTGERRTLEAMASSYQMDGAEYFLSSWVDITDRLRAEEARRQAELRYRELFDGVRDIVFSLSPEGEITMLNPAFERITGMPTPDWIGKPFHEALHPDDRARAGEQLAVSLTGQPPDAAPLRLRSKNAYFFAEVRTAPRREGDRVVSVLGIARDVSERVSLEEQLRQSQKMEAMGQLAGGIAHDFNNVLAVIMANADLLAESLPGTATDTPQELRDVQDAAQHGKAMIKQLMGFSRAGRLEPRATDMAALADRVARMLRRILPASISVGTTAEVALPAALADSGTVEQMIMNLATNARDAMPRGGKLSITVGRGDAAALPVDGPDSRVRSECVSIAVTDTGVGMDAETVRRVFEPFFTTKPAGAGTGLGLTMVSGLMRQHGGYVSVTSRPGAGTTVRLGFAGARGAAVAPRAAGKPAVPVALGGAETILVVEDEEAIRRAAQRILEKHGYRVLTAQDGDVALLLLQQGGRRVDLVITDLNMPNAGGIALYRAVRELLGAQAPPFLVASGSEEKQARESEGLPADVPFIRKPWTLLELLESVRQALHARPPAAKP